MKGIILAGGNGSRLHPITKGISKQLIPIYDKPMIYYPLSILMLSKLQNILIISNPEYLDHYKDLLGDGEHLGIKIEYICQPEPKGIADAFILGEEFIGNDSACLILGDNVFYGQGFVPKLIEATELKEGALIFGYYVPDPRDFGVVEFDKYFNVISIEEKPMNPKSHYAIPGLYFYDNSVVSKAKKLTASSRGELEITDLNKEYLVMGKLKVELLGRGFAWLDTGSCDGIARASSFVQTIQNRTGLYIGCLEEISLRNKWITREKLYAIGKAYEKTNYGRYLLSIANDETGLL
jgi:glucose-1-phosphate thymidylyltransferase